MRHFCWALFAIFLLGACNANSPENRYLLAERLLEDKKYDAAISEFREIVDKSPNSDLGIESQLKVAQILHLYLGRTKEAVEAYKKFLRRNKDEKRQNEIERVLADLRFQTFEDYQEAINAYTALLEKDPASADAPYYLFNIGRAHSFKKNFDEAIKVFQKLIAEHSSSQYAQRARLEIASSMNMAGRCKEAIKKYDDVIKEASEELKALAVFGQAECYEELDDLDKAYEVLGTIKKSYPTPAVVDLKMKRIKRRKILRRR